MIHFIIDTMMTREQMEALEIGDGCATCNLCVCVGILNKSLLVPSSNTRRCVVSLWDLKQTDKMLK